MNHTKNVAMLFFAIGHKRIRIGKEVGKIKNGENIPRFVQYSKLVSLSD